MINRFERQSLIKSKQLGMSQGKASGILRKKIMFWLVCKNGMNKCFRCNEPMTENNITIEHKKEWQYSNNPLELFMDLKNITFSHHKCNCLNRRGQRKCGESKYKGVIYKKDKKCYKPWRIHMWNGNKVVYKGYYKTAKQAAVAYDKEIIKLRGKNVITNKKLGLL